MKPKLSEKWRIKFRKEIYPELKNYGDEAYLFLIEDFITSLLKELREEVEGMKKPMVFVYCQHHSGITSPKELKQCNICHFEEEPEIYNQALLDVLSKLNQMIGGKE